MKKILFLLLLCGMAYGQTRTTYLKLPQWTTGDTLKAGTANDTAQSNFSLNNAFARLESILKNAGLTTGADSGYFSHIRGAGGTDLIINPGYSSGTVRRLIVSDSLYTVYNATFDQNALIAGNLTVGGYITTDSIQTNGTLTFDDTVRFWGATEIKNNLYVEDTLELGNSGGGFGIIRMYAHTFGPIASYFYSLRATSSPSANRTFTLPDTSGTIALTDGNQDFNNIREITADSLTIGGKIETGTYIRIAESNDSPNGSINDADMFVYKNGGGNYYFVIKFNDGGTIRYRYMQLDGTSATWTHGTSLP